MQVRQRVVYRLRRGCLQECVWHWKIVIDTDKQRTAYGKGTAILLFKRLASEWRRDALVVLVARWRMHLERWKRQVASIDGEFKFTSSVFHFKAASSRNALHKWRDFARLKVRCLLLLQISRCSTLRRHFLHHWRRNIARMRENIGHHLQAHAHRKTVAFRTMQLQSEIKAGKILARQVCTLLWCSRALAILLAIRRFVTENICFRQEPSRCDGSAAKPSCCGNIRPETLLLATQV